MPLALDSPSCSESGYSKELWAETDLLGIQLCVLFMAGSKVDPMAQICDTVFEKERKRKSAFMGSMASLFKGGSSIHIAM